METTNTQLKSPKRKIRTVFLSVTAGLAVMLLISHYVWKRSGSNQWELSLDKNGTKIWTMKTPGSTLIKVKAVGKVKTKLSGMVRLIEDPDSCAEAGCTDSKIIEKVESRPGFYTAYNTFRFNMPFPIQTREYVIALQHYQNPHSKIIEVNLLAAPNKTHPANDAVRVTHMHSIWRLTPLQHNEMEVEYVQDFDMGGCVPYFLTNLFLPEVAKKVMHDLPELMNKEKYRNAKVDYVMETN